MANIFNTVPLSIPKRNHFNMSHFVKTTFEMGQLIPFFVQDIIPNDGMKVSVQNLIRFAPLLAPIMSEVDVYVHFFFVPNRIIWSNWEDFITGSHNGKKLAEEDVPQAPRFVFSGNELNNAINPTGTAYPILSHKSLADYMGFQTFKKTDSFSNGTYPLDAMPFRAYQKIWSDYYRDENLQEDIFDPDINPLSDFSGDQEVTSSTRTAAYTWLGIRNRAWKKDYFTSALPWAQKGDDVLIPGTGNSSSIGFNPNSQIPLSKLYDGTFGYTGLSSVVDGTVKTEFGTNVSGKGKPIRLNLGTAFTAGSTEIGTGYLDIDPKSLGVSPTDLNNALLSGDAVSEGTIRELRRAFAAQKFLERRAVGGTRYIEQNLAFFGVKSSDARLQRAEFLGGMKNPMVVSQLLQTSESTQNSPLGQPAGNAVAANSKYIFTKKRFEEYGWVIGIISVMPKSDYMTGIPRMYQRRDVYDYYFPQFAHIGEQAILNSEIYFDPTKGTEGQGTFGYTPRYAEYRFRNNRVSGDFKDTLKFWTLGRDFTMTPTLSEEFITAQPSKRVFAVEDTDFSHLWAELHINCQMIRPIPKYAESL